MAFPERKRAMGMPLARFEVHLMFAAYKMNIDISNASRACCGPGRTASVEDFKQLIDS